MSVMVDKKIGTNITTYSRKNTIPIIRNTWDILSNSLTTRQVDEVTVEILQETRGGRPRKMVYKFRRDNITASSYTRFKYDDWGNVIYLLHIIINTHGVETQELHMVYDEHELISYRDNLGNEWRKEWNAPNPFKYNMGLVGRCENDYGIKRNGIEHQYKKRLEMLKQYTLSIKMLEKYYKRDSFLYKEGNG